MGTTSIFKDPHVAKHLSHFNNKYVVVHADKAPNNVVFVCKSHCIYCLIKEVDIDNALGTLRTSQQHVRKKMPLTIIGMFCAPYAFQLRMNNWIFRHSTGLLNYRGLCYIATKPLSKLLPSILLAIKTGIQSNCDTSYSK